ncbi:MAG: cell division protein ZapA [Desulfobulbaceae bacterium]|jgi:cell division protein ZapA (FtsZ GTPase activity inhibitor)|nr:cell division protein ZapA [Desulfobulbaceae bacterium]
MAEQERQVQIELLGQEYRFFTAAGEEELAEILSLVRQLVETDSTTTNRGTLVSTRLVTLACLNIASQYVRLKNEFDRFRLENSRRLTEMAATIEEDLGEG